MQKTSNSGGVSRGASELGVKPGSSDNDDLNPEATIDETQVETRCRSIPVVPDGQTAVKFGRMCFRVIKSSTGGRR